MASSWNGPESNMDTEVIYAIGAVTVSILGALRFSRCTRIKCGCIEIDRDATKEEIAQQRGDAVAVAGVPGRGLTPKSQPEA